MPLLDKDDVVFAVCVGCPKDEGWMSIITRAQEALDEARMTLKTKGDGPKHG